ncbi:MFS transporter [Candidatus Omnitrophota bacterium]
MIKLLTQKKHANFMRLWLAQLISQFGDRIHQMALVGLITERVGVSATNLAMIMAFTILPVFVVQPIAGVFIDRWDRKITLFICDIARGLLVILIPLVFIYWKAIFPIYIIVFLSFSFSRFHVPAKMSIIPDVVDEDNLISANSLITTTGMIASVLGLGLGGLLIEKLGSRNGFFVDALTFFLSGSLIATIVIPKKLKIQPTVIFEKSKEIVGTIRKTFWQEFSEGFKYLFEHKELRLVVNVFFILLSAVGAMYVVSIVFIQEAFKSTTMHLGSIAVSLCVGLFLGVMIYGKWGKPDEWHKTIFSCLTAGGVALVAFAVTVQNYPNIWAAMFLSMILGMVVGPIFVASYTMVHVLCDESMRGKVFSYLEIVIHLAFLISMLISSALAKYVDGVYILVAVGIIFAIIGLLGFIKVKSYKVDLPGGDVA